MIRITYSLVARHFNFDNSNSFWVVHSNKNAAKFAFVAKSISINSYKAIITLNKGTNNARKRTYIMMTL